jgi:hypothetical protein
MRQTVKIGNTSSFLKTVPQPADQLENELSIDHFIHPCDALCQNLSGPFRTYGEAGRTRVVTVGPGLCLILQSRHMWLHRKPFELSTKGSTMSCVTSFLAYQAHWLGIHNSTHLISLQIAYACGHQYKAWTTSSLSESQICNDQSNLHIVDAAKCRTHYM